MGRLIMVSPTKRLDYCVTHQVAKFNLTQRPHPTLPCGFRIASVEAAECADGTKQIVLRRNRHNSRKRRKPISPKGFRFRFKRVEQSEFYHPIRERLKNSNHARELA